MSGQRQVGTPPVLAGLSAYVAGADIVIVEGFKSAPIPKIELRRRASPTQDPLAPHDSRIAAVAADYPVDAAELPLFDLEDADGIATFIAALAK
jgi:molybdopterin-guanine dinucleotide biosynthesis protein B